MKSVHENPFFFAAFAVWLILGAVWLFSSETGDAILFWSAHRSAFGDFFFRHVTRLGEGMAYFAVIFLAIWFRLRHAILISAMGLTVLAAANAAKAIFAQPRPAAFLRDSGRLDDINLVDGVDVHFGLSSFPSGHSMGAFALFAILALLIPYKKLPALVFFLLALAVAISRIYLVQHFFKDVYAGSIFGVFIALAFWSYSQRFPLDTPTWYNKRPKLKS